MKVQQTLIIGNEPVILKANFPSKKIAFYEEIRNAEVIYMTINDEVIFKFNLEASQTETSWASMEIEEC